MEIFKGSGTAVAVPLHKDLSVNYEKMEASLERQIACGTDAVIIGRTVGETWVLSEEEFMSVIRFTIDKVASRIPVIAETGSNNTKTAMDLSRDAAECGADGLLIVTPYYNKTTQNGLVEYYSAVAKAVGPIPIIADNAPDRTGCNLLPGTIAKLYRDIENIVGIKETTGDITQAARVMQQTDGRIGLYSGRDDQIVPILALGGSGAISRIANEIPKVIHDMVADFFSGEIHESRKLQFHILSLLEKEP